MGYEEIDIKVRDSIVERGRNRNEVLGNASLVDDLDFDENELLDLFSELDSEFGVESSIAEMSSCETVEETSEHYFNKTR